MYKIASVSKQFIATCIMLLVEDGRLTLDDPLVRFLEGAPAEWNNDRLLMAAEWPALRPSGAFVGGGMSGFRAGFARFVDDGLTVIVLMNLDDVDLEGILRGVAGLFLPGGGSSAPENRQR